MRLERPSLADEVMTAEEAGVRVAKILASGNPDELVIILFLIRSLMVIFFLSWFALTITLK